MAGGMYKPDQGYWTRMCTAIAAGVLITSAAAWAYKNLDLITTPFEKVYLQGGVATLIILLGGILVYWLVYLKPSSSEFLIATDGEMKKVNWSSRREIFGSTWVVITVAFVIATLVFFVDIGFSRFFQLIHVLEKPS